MNDKTTNSTTRREMFRALFEPPNGWKDDETFSADFAAFEATIRDNPTAFWSFVSPGAPTFRSAAEAAELALTRLREAVDFQGDPTLDAGAHFVSKTLDAIVKDLREMSQAFDEPEEP